MFEHSTRIRSGAKSEEVISDAALSLSCSSTTHFTATLESMTTAGINARPAFRAVRCRYRFDASSFCDGALRLSPRNHFRPPLTLPQEVPCVQPPRSVRYARRGYVKREPRIPEHF